MTLLIAASTRPRAASPRLDHPIRARERGANSAGDDGWRDRGSPCRPDAASGAALVVGAVPDFPDGRDRVVAPAARHAILAIHERGELVVASRSMSYGTSLAWTYSQIGICTGRILRGENSADPPVVQAI